MGRGRSSWQDGRRAWARLNHWYLRPPRGWDNEDPAGLGLAAAAALKAVTIVRHLLDDLELKLVQIARARGVSWAEIATPLGVSKQTAWEKWREFDAEPQARINGML